MRRHHEPAVRIVRALMDIVELANGAPPPPPLAPARITCKHAKKIAKAACMLGFDDMVAKFARLPEGVDLSVAAAAAMALCDQGSKEEKKRRRQDKKGKKSGGRASMDTVAANDWVPSNKLYSLGVAAAEPDARKKLLKYAAKAAKQGVPNPSSQLAIQATHENMLFTFHWCPEVTNNLDIKVSIR